MPYLLAIESIFKETKKILQQFFCQFDVKLMMLFGRMRTEFVAGIGGEMQTADVSAIREKKNTEKCNAAGVRLLVQEGRYFLLYISPICKKESVESKSCIFFAVFFFSLFFHLLLFPSWLLSMTACFFLRLRFWISLPFLLNNTFTAVIARKISLLTILVPPLCILTVTVQIGTHIYIFAHIHRHQIFLISFIYLHNFYTHIRRNLDISTYLLLICKNIHIWALKNYLTISEVWSKFSLL